MRIFGSERISSLMQKLGMEEGEPIEVEEPEPELDEEGNPIEDPRVRFDEAKHIMVDTARMIKKDVELGEEHEPIALHVDAAHRVIFIVGGKLLGDECLKAQHVAEVNRPVKAADLRQHGHGHSPGGHAPDRLAGL